MKQNTILPFFFILIVFSSCKEFRSGKEDSSGRNLAALMQEPKHYVCYHIDQPLLIDGNLDKEVWKSVPWTDAFQDIEGNIKPTPTQNTRVKMLWDDSCIYVGAVLNEKHIWANLLNHDDIVFHDNDFEIFIDPDNDAKNYFEFEINANKAIFDLFLPHPYRHSSFALHTWDFKGMRYAVKINGTLNNGRDVDSNWTVEVAIPFSTLSFGLENGKPNVDIPCRINFSRVEWDTDWNGIQYIKQKDAQGKPKAEHNWVWSPVGEVSMHMPERYGYLKFSKNKAGSKPEEFQLSKDEKDKRSLWAVFYAEEVYYAKHHQYTAQLTELEKDLRDILAKEGSKISIKSTFHDYEAKLHRIPDSLSLFIGNQGFIR